MSTNLPSLPALTPLQSLDQQNNEALQDALKQYKSANASGISGVNNYITNAEKALGANTSTDTTLPSTVTGQDSTSQKTASGTNRLSELFDAVNPLSVAKQQGDYLVRGVVILLGLVLVAGAVFGFRQLTETVVNTTKTAATVAA
jgi:spore maturation protein SpmA